MMLNQWHGWSARQRVRAALVSVVALVVLVVLYRVRGALLPFALGLGLAYLALPFVDWLEDHAPALLRRANLARPLAIAVVYVVALGLIVAFFAYLVPVIVGQVEQLVAQREQREQILLALQSQFAALRAWYLATVPAELRVAIESRLQGAGDSLLRALQTGIIGGLIAVGNTVSLVLGYLAIPFWLIFVLYDAHDYRRTAHDLIPESIRPDVANVAHILDDVLSGYLRGQLIVASITGALTAIALSIIGVEFAVLLGFMVAVLDLVPTFGPIIALVPVTLIAAMGRPINALWAVVALVGVQQVENAIIGPRVVGESVQVRPAVLMLLLVIGNELAGVLGLVIIVPLAAMLRDVIRYIYIRTRADGPAPAESLAEVRQARRRRPAAPDVSLPGEQASSDDRAVEGPSQT